MNTKVWDLIDRGIKQRVYALNKFIDEIFNEQKTLKDGIIPKEMILSSVAYRKECKGLKPPKGIWCHISGIDLIRYRDGQFYVHKDNFRCPSEVSCVL